MHWLTEKKLQSNQYLPWLPFAFSKMLLTRLLALTSVEINWQKLVRIVLGCKSLASLGGVEHTAFTDGPRRSGFIVGVVWAISVANRFLLTYLFIRFNVDLTLRSFSQHWESSLKLSLGWSFGLICLLLNHDSYSAFRSIIMDSHLFLLFALITPYYHEKEMLLWDGGRRKCYPL